MRAGSRSGEAVSGTPASFDAGVRARLGVSELVGVDEAGRGPLAGPVVVAAVALRAGEHPGLAGVRDSKLLTPARREALYRPILSAARAVSLAWAHPSEIDRLNILRATLAAMRRAVRRAGGEGFVLVDGNQTIPRLGRPQLAVVAGDALSLSVACASVIAKVYRDRWMARLDRRFPGYGFARHKGYATELHLETLKKLGPSPIHRRSYAPVAELLLPGVEA